MLLLGVMHGRVLIRHAYKYKRVGVSGYRPGPMVCIENVVMIMSWPPCYAEIRTPAKDPLPSFILFSATLSFADPVCFLRTQVRCPLSVSSMKFSSSKICNIQSLYLSNLICKSKSYSPFIKNRKFVFHKYDF